MLGLYIKTYIDTKKFYLLQSYHLYMAVV